jgi:SET domain-containing protein
MNKEALFKITANDYGKCMIALKDLPKGTVVGTWEGYVVDSYDEVPKNLKLYAILIDEKRFLVPTNECMFANHSCDPNCEVNDDLEIVTLRPVEKSEELAYDYALCEGDEELEWNHEWDFLCKCGSSNCRGKIDRYHRVT